TLSHILPLKHYTPAGCSSPVTLSQQGVTVTQTRSSTTRLMSLGHHVSHAVPNCSQSRGTQDPQTKSHSSSLSADREASLGDTGADAEIGGTERYNASVLSVAAFDLGTSIKANLIRQRKVTCTQGGQEEVAFVPRGDASVPEDCGLCDENEAVALTSCGAERRSHTQGSVL
ncbi:Coiled-coil domain containing protein 66, partial [Dissostichus eleginoides]